MSIANQQWMFVELITSLLSTSETLKMAHKAGEGERVWKFPSVIRGAQLYTIRKVTEKRHTHIHRQIKKTKGSGCDLFPVILSWVGLDFPNLDTLFMFLKAIVKIRRVGILGLFSEYPKNRTKKRAESSVAGTTAKTKKLRFLGPEAMWKECSFTHRDTYTHIHTCSHALECTRGCIYSCGWQKVD